MRTAHPADRAVLAWTPLASVKADYDPGNRVRGNQNIQPAP
jgi:hypothetical protein